ncbi:hypothetical protein [Microbulbifer sp. ZKSA002]|uniref:hypothetical protein n=1 Tax=Microbulbifer sp. ZKSA002 TaxID=3243388 RepID=UPI004039EE28
MKYVISIIFSCFLAVSAVAEPAYTGDAVPSFLHIFSETGNAYVDHQSGYCNTDRFVLYTTHEKYDAVFSMLLSAQMAEKEVMIRFDGCVNDGDFGKIIGVYLK